MYFDIVIPNNNEVSLVRNGEKLGFKELIFLYSDSRKAPSISFSSKIKVRKGFFVRSINEISEAKKHFEMIFAPAQREFFESGKVDCIVISEGQQGHDFLYQRRAELDDVMCALAKEKNKLLVFDAGVGDGKFVFGRMLQDARLCRQYDLRISVATFAKHPLEMRASKDLDGFARTIRLL